MTIVALTDFTEYVGSEIVANQVQLEAALTAAELAVQHYCRRPFAAPATAATARIFDTHLGVVLYVDEFVDITGLIVDNDGTIIAAADYRLEPVDGLQYGIATPYSTIRLLDGTSWADEVTVTARWGWVAADVKMAVLVLAKDIAGLRDTRFGVAGWGEFGVVRMRENPQVMSLLAPHVRWDRAGIA
jgi:hypothetical protein